MCKYECISNECGANPPCIIDMGGTHPGVEPECCIIGDSDCPVYVSWQKLPQTSSAKEENSNSAELLKFCKQEMKVADDRMMKIERNKESTLWEVGYKTAFKNIIEAFELDKVPAIPCPSENTTQKG